MKERSMDIFEIGAMDEAEYVRLRKGRPDVPSPMRVGGAVAGGGGEGTRGGHIIGHTSGGKPIYASSHPTYQTRAKRRGWNVDTTPQHADAHGGGKHTRAAFAEHGYDKQDHEDAARHHAKDSGEYARSWQAAVKDAEHKYGSHGSEIAGVHRDHFPEHVKNKLRYFASNASQSSTIARAHWSASGKRSRIEDATNREHLYPGGLVEHGAQKSLSARPDGAVYHLTGEQNLVAVNTDIGSELLAKCGMVAQNHPRFGGGDFDPTRGMDGQRSVLEKATRFSESDSKFFGKSGGEGTRGGQVIGHTSGGKPIYAPGHESYAATAGKDGRRALHAFGQDYNRKDHEDAEAMHSEHAAVARGRHDSDTARAHDDAAVTHEKILRYVKASTPDIRLRPRTDK